jgi:hypothetical protein
MAESKRGRGRPTGSPTKEYITIQIIPVRCRKCGCSEFINRKCMILREISGIAPDGQPYNQVRHVNCQCAQCQQWHRLIEYDQAAE